MATRRPNHRLVKKHRSYTVEEIASLLRVHRNTVHQWIKRAGLPTIDGQRPMLVLGQDLIDFLLARRHRNKQRCQPGEIFCVRCRAPKAPAGDIADYIPRTPKLGQLIGICPTCDRFIYRSVNPTRLEQVRGKLVVKWPKASERIDESAVALVNCDFEQERADHGKAQPG